MREFSSDLRPGLRDPVVEILLVAGLFDAVSGNPVDSILLVVTGFALAGRRPEAQVTVVEPGEERARAGRSLSLVVGGILVALAYAWVVGSLERFSWPATFAVIIPGGAAMVLAWRTPGPTPGSIALRPADRRAWTAVFVGVGLWELTNLLLQPSLTTDSYAHPTLSVLSEGFLGSHPGRSVALFLWLVLGWYLVDR